MSLALPLLAIVAAMRLGELLLSRRRIHQAAAAGDAKAIQEPAYPYMVAVHGAWLAGCVIEPYVTHPVIPPIVQGAALAVWGVALLLRFWLMWALGRFWNVRLVQRGDQPVITRGPYRYVRHPNYVAVVLELAAVPVAVGAYGTAILAGIANALVLWRRIAREEAYLFTVPGYKAAFAHKKRLIPGVF